MSNQQIINECRDGILKALADNEGDILKSELYGLIECGELTDIAMAIKSLRDEGKIVVFGDGKAARIVSGNQLVDFKEKAIEISNKFPFTPVSMPIIKNTPSPTELAKVSEIVVGKIAETQPIKSNVITDLAAVIKDVNENDGSKQSHIEPVLPKQVPGNLTVTGLTANAAYCLFVAKTDGKFDALTLDIIASRLKFKGSRGSLNGAVDYLVKQEYVTKYRVGPKPLFYWSGKFSRPFQKDVIPSPIESGSRSPFLPPKVTYPNNEELVETLKQEIGTIKVEDKAVEIEIDKSSEQLPDFSQEIKYSKGAILVPEPLDDNAQARISEINNQISRTIVSINGLTDFLRLLNEEKVKFYSR